VRIVIVGGFRFPFGDAAGARCRVMATAMAKRGVGVTVISQLPGKGNSNARDETGAYLFNGIRYFIEIEEAIEERRYWKRVINIIRGSVLSARRAAEEMTKGRCDIVLFSGNYNIFLLPILFAARRNGRPIVGEAMEWFNSFSFKGGYWNPLAWDHEICMRFSNRRLDGLIVISNFLFTYYRSRKTKPLLVPSLYAWGKCPPKWSVNDEFTIGYFGTPTEKDGIYDLLSALEHLSKNGRKFRFLLGGDDGRTGNLERIRGIVRSSPHLSGSVILLGLIEQERIEAVFSVCNLLVLARPAARFSAAGVPQKLAEYMAMGRAVVVTAVGDIPLYVRNGVDGFVVAPSDPSAFATAIEAVMKMEDKGEAMGMAAWRDGRRFFDCERHAARIVEYLGEVNHRHAALPSTRRKRAVNSEPTGV
jgi:glycosyltransferase involved in cell wall biosynthesis